MEFPVGENIVCAPVSHKNILHQISIYSFFSSFCVQRQPNLFIQVGLAWAWAKSSIWFAQAHSTPKIIYTQHAKQFSILFDVITGTKGEPSHFLHKLSTVINVSVALNKRKSEATFVHSKYEHKLPFQAMHAFNNRSRFNFAADVGGSIKIIQNEYHNVDALRLNRP